MRLHLKINTKVPLPAGKVLSGFSRALFLSLNPPFPPVKLLRFDGCKKGDLVELELNFLLFRQRWVSEITDDYDRPKELGFVDVGTKLPFFLSEWTHRHRILKLSEQESMIVDDISYSGGGVVLSLLLYPALWLQFVYRKPIYRKWFSGSKVF